MCEDVVDPALPGSSSGFFCRAEKQIRLIMLVGIDALHKVDVINGDPLINAEANRSQTTLQTLRSTHYNSVRPETGDWHSLAVEKKFG